MKIVLVSPFNIANYGAMLQGWALRTVLERLGHDVYHLDVPWLWHGIRSWWRILRSRSFNAMCFKVKLNGVIRRAFAMMGKPPVTAKYCSVSALKRNPPVADCYIAGSDQIWNINFLRSKGSADVVLLNFAPYGVKIELFSRFREDDRALVIKSAGSAIFLFAYSGAYCNEL